MSTASKNGATLTDGIAIDKQKLSAGLESASGLRQQAQIPPQYRQQQVPQQSPQQRAQYQQQSQPMQQQIPAGIANGRVNGGYPPQQQHQQPQQVPANRAPPTQQQRPSNGARTGPPSSAAPVPSQHLQQQQQQQQAQQQLSQGRAATANGSAPASAAAPRTPAKPTAGPQVATSTPNQAPQQQQQDSKNKSMGIGGSIPEKPPKIVKKRLRKVETKPKAYDKYAWIAGHVLCIVGSIIYATFYLTFRSHKSTYAWLSYRIAFAGVIVAYSVSLVNAFGKLPPSYFTLLTTENFQYLLLAYVWLFNRSSLFKVLPYFLISVLQLSSFFKLKPLLKFDHAFREAIVYNELFLFVLLFFDTLLLRGTSGYALVIFAMFYSLKLVFSDETKGLVYSIVIKADGVLSKQKNPKVQALWHDIKSFLLKKKERAETYRFHVKK